MRFRQARHYYPGRVRRVSRIGIHITATSARTSTAWGVAGYFASTNVKASAHVTCDDGEVVGSVLTRDTAFGIGSLNSPTLHIEHVGTLADVADWARGPSRVPALEHSAQWAAKQCLEHGIFPVRLQGADIFDYRRTGFVAHADADRASGDRTPHGDPGELFPWTWYLNRVAYLMGQDTTPMQPPTSPEDEMPAPDTITAALAYRGGLVLLQWDGGTRFIERPGGWQDAVAWPFEGPFSIPGLPEDQRRIPPGFTEIVANDRGGFDIIHELGAIFSYPVA